jgi:F-type H+-transporting ATPase subunit b
MQVIKEGLLRVDPGLMIWTIATFAVLLLILWKAAWKPIVDALDARAEKIRGDIDNAERSRQEAERLLVEHREMMTNARNEASAIIAKGRDDAEKLRTQISETANSEAREIAERAKREIELAKEKALMDIKNEVVKVSTEIAAKIIKKNIKPEDHKALIEEALNRAGTIQ